MKTPSPWDMVQDLIAQIDHLKPKEQRFIWNLFEHLDPANPYEELSEKQWSYLDDLYRKHVKQRFF